VDQQRTPEQDIAERLAGRPGRGTFEAHVTVAADTPAERERFRALCGELGVKCVLIELPEGESRSQPMTSSYHRGELAAVVGEVSGLSQRLRDAGFPVTRLKLEAVATNDGVPETDAEARALPADNYFEFHVKLLLPADADLAALRACCARHDARLSRNALKSSADGRSERFATLRLYHVGRATAFAHCDRLADDLSSAGFAVGGRLREYSLYDSAVGLDAGWIDAPAASGPKP
jgi:hypothetical protein